MDSAGAKNYVGRRRFRHLLASSSVAALLIGGGASAAFAQCAINPVTNQTSVSNSAAINCININGITVTGNVTNTGPPNTGVITATGATAPTRTGITINNASVGGAIVNAGQITASTAGNGITVNNNATVSGGISNSGTISAGSFGGGILISGVAQFGTASAGGGISNSGTITAGGGAISLANVTSFYGGIVNTGTGTISGLRAIDIEFGSLFAGGITNRGTLTGGSTAVRVSGISTFQGGITNSGTIAGTGGILVNNGSTFLGGITNSGTISASSSRGIAVSSIVQFGNSSSAGGIANSGTISAAGSGILVKSVATFFGGISNSGTISAGNNGIFFGGVARTGETVTISTFGGGISNAGLISAGAGFNGIFVGGTAAGGTVTIASFGGGITNSGTISAGPGANGIFVGGIAACGGALTISTFSGGISNAGTISAGLNGIFVTDVVQFGTTSAGGGISNSGTISAGFFGVGIYVLNVSTFLGGITNSGLITAGTDGAGIVVGATAFYGNVSNSGTISGGHTGIDICDCATFHGGAIVNSGTISANTNAINASIATSPITIDQVAGLISGDILLSTNADQLNIYGGTIAGNIVGQGLDNITFALGAGNTFTYGFNFTGIDAVNIDSGTVVLNGTDSATTVNVNSGGTLAGTGTVDPLTVTINSGGTLEPGTPGVPGGMLSITGNLVFESGSFYEIAINPTQHSLGTVSGTVTINGGTVVLAPSGPLGTHYSASTFAILTSTGMVSGTFNPTVTYADALQLSSTPSLSYDATDVFLSYGNSLADLATPPGANQNQQNVINGINNAILAGDTVPNGFNQLIGLSIPAYLNALTQLSGEVATGAEQSAFQLTTEFLNLMLDPFVNGRGNGGGGGGGNGPALGFAPDRQASLPPDIALAYAEVLKAPAPSHPSPASGGGSGWGFDQRWGAWGTAYGGANNTEGNATVGSHDLSAQTYGFAAGMDYRISPYSVAGFALGGGGTSWDLANALGSGYSQAFQFGGYGIEWFGPAYLAGALSFTNNWFTTNRTALGDQLRANFSGQSYGARFEGGYRYAVLPTLGVTPYSAVQFQDFHTPSYSENDLTGGGFGLSYNAMNATDVRTELGARFDDPTLLYGKPLILFGRLAWAHDFVSNPALSAAFEALPGSSFTVFGAPIPRDSALTTAGAQYFLSANWQVIAKFDGEFAPGSQTYAGTGTLRYTW